MNGSNLKQLADAVLYEGYNLYPYRPSALKNRLRWMFGCVLPKPWCELHPVGERWNSQTQCLLVGGLHASVEVQVRFLQPTMRVVGRLCRGVDKNARSVTADDGSTLYYHATDVLEVDEELYQTWQETEERSIAETFHIEELLQHAYSRQFVFSAEARTEVLRTKIGDEVGVVVRECRPLAAQLSVDCQRCPDAAGLFRLTVRVENTTEFSEAATATRDDALLSSLVSMHTILHAVDGEFVSSIDPPSQFRTAAESCKNIGTWPVLVGDSRQPTTMLAAPIILDDFPQVAPESPGDLFDGTEIDELLSLRIRTLTDGEKREAASADERTRRLMQRTESLDGHILKSLHGAQRGRNDSHADDSGFQIGDRVRLRPSRRADAFDLMLDGKTAVITAVERDFENNVHLAVTIDDDPGRDLGARGMPGHRFFFYPDEVERLDEEQP
jgi:hypothetical protein